MSYDSAPMVSTMQIILPAELERSLIERARQVGTSPENLALTVLRQQLGQDVRSSDDTATLADFLAEHIGVLGNEAEGKHASARETVPFSEQCGRRFGTGLLDRHRRQTSSS